jgi:hypothetical protein
MDDTWEMNIHFNAIDEETEETLKRHKGIL